MLLKKRIPTAIGLLLLIVGAISGVIFINKGTDFLPRAAPEYAPQKVKITNVTENSFVASWITKESTTGFIKYGTSASTLSTTATDDRDQLAGASGEYRTHYISIQNLKPGTTYYFKLGSQKNQLYDNNGKAFSLTTPLAISTPPPADTVYGTVVTTADTPAEGAIVYLSLENATPISALVKQNGNWAANLSTARSTDLSAYATYDSQTAPLSIMVQPGTGNQAKVTTTVGQAKPVSKITLGEERNEANPVATPMPTPAPTVTPTVMPSEIPAATPSATSTTESKFNINQLDVVEDTSITVITIPKDGAEVASARPTLEGKAPKNTQLTISVHSATAYTATITTNAVGAWEWTPPADLEPGSHTLTLSYTDADGTVHKVTRDFVVASATIQSADLAYEATPSADTEVAATPTPKPTATPKPTPTPKPSATPRTVSTASGSATIVAGSTAPTIVFMLIGLISLSLGVYTLRRE